MGDLAKGAKRVGIRLKKESRGDLGVCLGGCRQGAEGLAGLGAEIRSVGQEGGGLGLGGDGHVGEAGGGAEEEVGGIGELGAFDPG
jgi:hypothetical protein